MDITILKAVSCPASGQQCYNCSGLRHYTALCKKPRTPKQYNCPNRPMSRRPSHRYSSRPATRGNSRSPSRGRSYRSPSRSPHHKQYRSPQCNSRKRRSPTPHIHQVSHITHILPRPYAAEGQLITLEHPMVTLLSTQHYKLILNKVPSPYQ